MRNAIIVIVIVILLGIFGPQTLYTVDETQFAVVTRFGDIRAVHTSPGIKFKAPFIDSVNRFDNRVLRIDTPPRTLNDIDKQNLVIDSYTRYRIKPTKEDVKKFFEKLRTLGGAEDRLGSIVSSNLKEEVAQRTRQEIIGGRIEKTPEGETLVIATNTRQEILDRVLAAANREVGPEGEDLGVEIVDVRIKRAEFPTDALPNIFNRMRAERDRISKELRAQGQEEKDKIEASANRDRTIILANAEKDANIRRGEGEAKAIEIFAKALEQDPEFFAFQRSLEAYKKFLSTNTTVILSSEAELFQFLQQTDFIPVQKPKAIVGSIESMSGNLWTVGDQEVRVNGATRINIGNVPIVGLSIFLEGTTQEDGSIEAAEVIEGISGLLEQISVAELVVDNQVVAVNEATDIRIDPQKVVTVYVEGERTSDKLVATQITEGVRGTLDTKTDTIWSVGTTDIIVNDSAEIEEGSDQIGADVLVSVERKSDDSLVALKIFLQQPAETAERLAGTVSAITKEWKVAGSDQVITVNEDSNIQLGADQVGLAVLIGFARQDDGSLLVLEGRIE